MNTLVLGVEPAEKGLMHHPPADPGTEILSPAPWQQTESSLSSPASPSSLQAVWK
ncbi:hypothetical protein [uncultured Methanofollis sp.]|uniref:hypothetical protein n=1 Tax=uncultured Methanofollis sp. TaxID=262500 RepID=UPI00261B4412|nr:hypothetical protein [uncultured Methanofollis sp.]